ncbi:hypothetical protein ABID25_006718 [Mesorhizobium abyssinicae]
MSDLPMLTPEQMHRIKPYFLCRMVFREWMTAGC